MDYFHKCLSSIRGSGFKIDKKILVGSSVLLSIFVFSCSQSARERTPTFVVSDSINNGRG